MSRPVVTAHGAEAEPAIPPRFPARARRHGLSAYEPICAFKGRALLLSDVRPAPERTSAELERTAPGGESRGSGGGAKKRVFTSLMSSGASEKS